MNNYHDPVRHLEYLRQSLSQSNKPIGFFLSAGCPLAVKMPSGSWPLIPDVENLTKWLNSELATFPKYQNLLDELERAGKNKENIEDILSFLRSLIAVVKGGTVRGLNETELGDIEKEICKKIVTKIKVNLPDDKTPYHSLVKWINSIDREIPIEVFTTNYDLLLEQALEQLEVPYFDGFVGTIKAFFDLRTVEQKLIPYHWTRLWKIHGSLNWYQDKTTCNNIFRISDVKDDGAQLIYPSHLKYDQSRKMPYLALIDQLCNFIKQKSSILILSGYSFNDDHINDTIINALRANPSAMVLALMHKTYMIKDKDDNDLEERYPKAYKIANNRSNLNIWTSDKAIIGTNPGEWKMMKPTDEQSILDFIEKNTIPVAGSADITRYHVKLGDFAVFADFLNRLIGVSDTSNDSIK
jgi:hypothetical protein